ncbi:hypothetical protein CKALI_03465 [Corynebacterium kalinowskii]|uniref:Or membrane protein n=1 Tax=Corynebacterium kalinowskii TaxID=2675216 RepID=A0A6B8VS55_9CORY|nr:hypothetical protein [Corynebacterium kalinowskii]QGU01576.1 hypothetical protein CKALI_03465 [Corynebacterium kalinowskii]
MEPIRVTSDFGALLRSPAARALGLLILVLAPLTWFLYRSLEATSNETLRLLYGLGVAAPAGGIVVAVFSFLGYLIRKRRTVLKVGEQVTLPRTGVDFALRDLDCLQVFTKDGASYLALFPAHVPERLTAATARSGNHKLDGYIVEFPQWPNLQTYEVADRILQVFPSVTVEKIGSV